MSGSISSIQTVETQLTFQMSGYLGAKGRTLTATFTLVLSASAMDYGFSGIVVLWLLEIEINKKFPSSIPNIELI